MKIKDQGSTLLRLHENRVGRESRKASRKYEIYKLFKAVSPGDLCKDLYVDQKPGGVMAEPGHSNMNRRS